MVSVTGQVLLAGGSKYCICSTLLGEMIQFDDHIFQMGWFNHQLVHDDSFVMGFFVPGIQEIKRQLDVRLLQIFSEAFICLMWSFTDSSMINHDFHHHLANIVCFFQAPNKQVRLMGFSNATIHPVKKGTCQLIKEPFLKRFGRIIFHSPVDQWEMEPCLHLAICRKILRSLSWSWMRLN